MARKIYEHQTKLRLRADLELESDENITGASAVIKYTKPDKTEGSFTAVIEDEYNGYIYYDIQDENDIVGVGKWVLWAHITFADGKVAPGDPFTLEVFKEGAIC